MVKRAGHCCSIERMHAMDNLYCVGGRNCLISLGEQYRRLLNENEEESMEVCCLKKVEGKTHVELYVDKHHQAKFSNTVERREYQPSDVEEWLECTKCRTQHHATCTVYHPAKDGKKFVCPRCDPLNIRTYRVEDLDTTQATDFFEKELKNPNEDQIIWSRILSAHKKPGDLFQQNRNNSYPNLRRLPPVSYVRKTYGFFIKRDGLDVLFLVLMTHEYKNVASRKNNTIHVEFLDSVKYVEHKPLAAVAESVFQAFCSYARDAGFETIYLWACPPPFTNEGYVFNARPGPPKQTNNQHLYDWYRSAGKCGSVQRVYQGCVTKDHGTLDDHLDALCYENNPIAGALEQSLEESKDLPEKNRIRHLRGTLGMDNKKMFYLRLKKADQVGVQQYEEALFPGSFASSAFLENQRAHKLEFHNLQSAKYATQLIIFCVKMERQLGDIQKLLVPVSETAPPAAIPQPAPPPVAQQVALPPPPAPPQNAPPPPQIPPAVAAAAVPPRPALPAPPPVPQIWYPNILRMVSELTDFYSVSSYFSFFQNAPPPQLAMLNRRQALAQIAPQPQVARPNLNNDLRFPQVRRFLFINPDGTPHL
ncbi:hypothetical protein CAEBREN_11977 [Caenorhabditis brenneri]|uniref:histone acetyltransferase n=1 Tax=Caenorhabditis brenneri TaxID=135651 RepID=G0MWI7_CAEBE|nr:hypothetical protein CAEBREN_11977 [Caenorhabditis brenneri]